MGGLQIGQSLVDLAVAVFYEGCIGETLAAALANEQLLVAVDEQARATLEWIAGDEAEHSLLAWRFLRHAVELGGGEVVQRLRRALSEAPEHVAAPAAQLPPALWNYFGRLTPQQERGVVEATWRDVIAPATELLLQHGAESHRNTERRAEA